MRAPAQLRWLLPLLAVASVACSRRPAPEVDAGEVEAARDGGEVAATVTPQRIDAWLGYQQRVAQRTTSDAGRLTVLQRATIDREERQRAGLLEADVDAVEAVVADVVAARSLARLTGEVALKELTRATRGLPEDERDSATAEAAEQKARLATSGELGPERARHTDAGVDAVLAREADVAARWEALMETRDVD